MNGFTLKLDVEFAIMSQARVMTFMTSQLTVRFIGFNSENTPLNSYKQNVLMVFHRNCENNEQ